MSSAAVSDDVGAGGVASSWRPRFDALTLDPLAHFLRVESEEVPPLEVGDTSLGDQTSDVTDRNAEMLRQLVDRHERREIAGSDGAWGCADGTHGQRR